MIDREERRAAVLTDDHAFVWASAGTGKTHTLTLRALFLLLQFAGPRLGVAEGARRREAAREILLSIVLTTFTRKAAAEMRTRLYGYLDALVGAADLEALRRSNPAAQDVLFVELVEEALDAWPGRSFELLRSGAEVLAERAAELQVSTIHSLAAAVLRRHALEAGLPPDCRFAREDEDDPTDYAERLVDRWWQTEAVENHAVGRLLDEVLRVVPLSDVRIWSRELLAHPWIADRLEAMDREPAAGEREVLQALRTLAGILQSLRGPKLRETGRRLVESIDRADWIELAAFLDENRRYLFEEPGKQLREALEERSRSMPTALDNPASFYFAALGRALGSDPLKNAWTAWRRLARLQADWFRGAGVRELKMVGFDDMIRRSVLLLESVPAVRRAERARLRAVLVDEFQDTDPWQLRLLACLLRRSEDSDHEVLGFFVGDLKQSIYRFRGADVNSIREFHRTYDARVGPARPARDFHLQTSFRTREPMVRFANHFFSDSLPLASRREWLHTPSTADRDGPRPRWIHLREGTKPLTAGRARELAARAVGRLVREVASRGVPWSDILVLARGNRDLDTLLSVLQAEGLPVIASGARTFYRHPEVLDTLNLLISLHNPLDHLAVAAVLRSPLVRLSNRQLGRLLGEMGAEAILFGDRPPPPHLPEYSRRRIETLREMLRARATEDFTRWLLRVERFVPKSAYLSAGDPEGRSAARIGRVIRAFGEECREGTAPPLVWLLKQRARSAQVDRWDVSLGEDVALADETVEAVRAMTIHKAKGLESGVVIVYDWNAILKEASLRLRRPGVVLDLGGEEGSEIREFSLKWGPTAIRTPGFETALELEGIRAVEEGRRLAYVAATRVKREIVFLYPDNKPWSGDEFVAELRHGPSSSLVEWAEWRDLPEVVPAEAAARPTFDRQAGAALWERRADFFGQRLRLLYRSTQGEGPDAAEEPVEIRSPSADRALAVGRLVHAYLERWVDMSSFRPDLLQVLLVGDGDGELRAAAEPILKAFFEGRYRDETGLPYRDRLRGGRILGREVPVFLECRGKRWHGVMDLVFREAGGRVVGVDYKTGRRQDPPPESYQLQQSVYSEALRRMGGPDAVFEFWWLGPAASPEPPQRTLPFD